MPPKTSAEYQIDSSVEVLVDTQSKPKILTGLWELTKPRLSFLSVVTALVSYLAAQPDRNFLLLLNFLCGTALSAGGAAAINQWMERKTDAIMLRTRDRPLPSHMVTPMHAILWGIFLSVTGTTQLFFGVNQLAALFGLSTILSYTLIYTPMKRRSRWATEVGAVSGSLPPLIGWAAAEGTISTLGWILFGILFFWQIPHFMAIAWTYRNDYESVNFPMLSVIDRFGHKVANWSMLHTVLLVVISLLPFFLGFCSSIYLIIAIFLGSYFLWRANAFRNAQKREIAARQLFIASIFYLPALLGFLVLDRWLW